MLYLIGNKTFCDIQIGLFIADRKFAISVVGLQKILISEKTIKTRNPKYRGMQFEHIQSEFITETKRDYKYLRWVIDGIEGELSFEFIIKQLLELKAEYKQDKIIKNDNKSITNSLRNILLESNNSFSLKFYDCDFDVQKSSDNLQGLLLDERVKLFEKIDSTFKKQIKLYDIETNQLPFINATLLTLDYIRKPSSGGSIRMSGVF